MDQISNELDWWNHYQLKSLLNIHLLGIGELSIRRDIQKVINRTLSLLVMTYASVPQPDASIQLAIFELVQHLVLNEYMAQEVAVFFFVLKRWMHSHALPFCEDEYWYFRSIALKLLVSNWICNKYFDKVYNNDYKRRNCCCCANVV